MDQDDLKELNEIFKDMGGVSTLDNYSSTSTFEELPDGTYLGEISEVESMNSKNSGKPMLKIVVTLEDGKKCYIYKMLAGDSIAKTQTAIARTITQLKDLGVVGIELEDFITNAKGLIGRRVNLSVTTTNNFINKYLTLA